MATVGIAADAPCLPEPRRLGPAGTSTHTHTRVAGTVGVAEGQAGWVVVVEGHAAYMWTWWSPTLSSLPPPATCPEVRLEAVTTS